MAQRRTSGSGQVHVDAVDALVAQWRDVRPDLGDDLAAMATIGRLGRLETLVRRAVEGVLDGHGLTVGEFDVLAALRRAGEPYELRPIDLARRMMLSPAGVTSRLDKLEAGGLVARRHDRVDRRSVLVRLTSEGLALVDRAVSDHVANEARLLAPLDAAQRRALDDALRTLLRTLDRHADAGGQPANSGTGDA